MDRDHLSLEIIFYPTLTRIRYRMQLRTISVISVTLSLTIDSATSLPCNARGRFFENKGITEKKKKIEVRSKDNYFSCFRSPRNILKLLKLFIIFLFFSQICLGMGEATSRVSFPMLGWFLFLLLEKRY